MSHNNHLKIGVFVLVAVALLIAGLLAFGAKTYFTPKTHFETAVEDDVSGLSVGSNVELRGVPIGKVTRITFAWHAYPGSKSQALVVEFEVDSDLMPWPPGEVRAIAQEAVSSGLRAIVKGQGITGTSLLSLEIVTPPPRTLSLDYAPHHYYIPSAGSQFSRILETVEKTLQHLEGLDFPGVSQGLTNALGAAEQFAQKLKQLDLETVVTNGNSLLVETRTAVVKVQNTIGQIQDTLKAMQLEQVGQNANSLLSDLRNSTVHLQNLLVKLNDVPLQEAVGDLQETLQTLNQTLVQMNRYPSGFFLGEPPVPATAVKQTRGRK
ncbi:MAG: hypothetical protein C5B50_18980 [Verrucomicrobia bacterium]|nr:MAG: hypothetical protein C5B50_18980 [Verrucomicrobiota bacterium]